MTVKLDSILSASQENEQIIDIKSFCKGEEEELKTTGGVILAVTDGLITITGENAMNTIASKKLVFLLPGVCYGLSSEADTTLVMFKLKEHISLYRDCFSDNDNAKTLKHGEPFGSPLGMNQEMKVFIHSVYTYFHNGQKPDIQLFDIKMQELFFLLKSYYKKEELKAFFLPLASSNSRFAYFVLNNYEGTKTVREFAEKANLSLSGFEKEFRRVFDTSPYRWMKQRKAQYLLGQISYSEKTFKEISEECGFSSTSQMNDFCKKEWGLPPGKIRKKVSREGITGVFVQ